MMKLPEWLPDVINIASYFLLFIVFIAIVSDFIDWKITTDYLRLVRIVIISILGLYVAHYLKHEENNE